MIPAQVALCLVCIYCTGKYQLVTVLRVKCWTHPLLDVLTKDVIGLEERRYPTLFAWSANIM